MSCSIARNRPHRGDLRRAEPGCQRWLAARGHAGAPSRARTPDQCHCPPVRSCRWRAAGAQGAHAGARHGGGRVTHRPRGHVAGRGHPVGARSPGDGAVDAWARSSDPSPSAMSVSSTGCSQRRFAGPGPSALVLGPSNSSSTSTPPSVRCAARPSMAPAMATPRSSATTPSSPSGRGPARCSTSGCARARPTPSAGRCVSSKSWWPGCAGREPREN